MSQVPRNIPIVLAAGSHLDQWPLSRHDMPIQFQVQADGSSRFQKTLSGFDKIAGENPIIVSVPARLLDTVKQQTKDCQLTCSTEFFVEPMDRGSLASALTASILSLSHDANAVLSFVDASTPPQDWNAVQRLIEASLGSPYLNSNIVCCGRLVDDPSTNGILVEATVRTTDPNLSAFQAADRSGQKRQFQLGAITITKAATFLSCLTADQPTLVSVANKAIKSASGGDNLFWPATNIWSTLPTLQLAKFLQQSDKSLLRPFDSTGNHQTNSNYAVELETENCVLKSDNHLLAVAGCADLTIYATKDATMIVPANRPDLRDALIAKLTAAERAELYEFKSDNLAASSVTRQA